MYRRDVPHVGKAIKAHRELLEITFEQLVASDDRSDTKTLAFAERAPLPSIEVVERHHRALIDAVEIKGPTRITQKCRREQWWTTDLDMELWRRASDLSPAVVWWWGIRLKSGERGAWCYLCRSLIHGYDVGRGVTAAARKAVMDHRMDHHDRIKAAKSAAKEGSNT